MNCKFCGTLLPEPAPGEIVRRRREYCSPAHRQADYRQRKVSATTKPGEISQADLHLQEALADKDARIAALEQTIYEQQRYITDLEHREPKPRPLTKTAAQYKAQILELERQNARLTFRLESSRASKQKRYHFYFWLHTQPATPFTARLRADLSEDLSNCAGTRTQHENMLRAFKYSDDALDQFSQLWERMLSDPRPGVVQGS